MENWVNISKDFFKTYVDSFDNLSDEQQRNFEIKKNHCFRVADNCKWLALKLKRDAEGENIAYISGLLHDVGRFQQLVDYDTFHDDRSVDHAELAVKILKGKDVLKAIPDTVQELIYTTIELHNKFQVSKKLTERELLYANLLRDGDKMDILKVLTDYYSSKNNEANHTLTWELPAGSAVSKKVAKDVLSGKLVSKKEVQTQIDVKVMQLSWIYDINYRPSIEHILDNRFLEKIYNSLSKTDTIIEIYRKVKVYAENKILV